MTVVVGGRESGVISEDESGYGGSHAIGTMSESSNLVFGRPSVAVSWLSNGWGLTTAGCGVLWRSPQRSGEKVKMVVVLLQNCHGVALERMDGAASGCVD
jgi:hypothetical protein